MAANSTKKIDRDEILKLYFHYEAVTKDELDFFFKYLNFYLGLLSALLAATLAGLQTFKNTNPHYVEYALLLGPFLIITISIIAYKNIRVYYRRFLEAVVTVFNLKSMLSYDTNPELSDNLHKPIFPSSFSGSFITKFNRPTTKKIIDEAVKQNLKGEELFEKLLSNGENLNLAKYILFGYRFVGFILLIVIIIRNYQYLIK